MAWNYSGNPASSSKDIVRFLVQDVDAARPLAQDEEIAWALTEEPSSVYLAAALVAEALAGKPGVVSSKGVGDLSLAYDPEFYRQLAVTLRRRVAARWAAPYAGGISKGDKSRQEQDSDRTGPVFTRGLHEHPGGTPGSEAG